MFTGKGGGKIGREAWVIAPLLFGSGFCALVYQIVWMRDFRLVFGASTMATAAVVAIFMGGLGFGGLVLGRRADRQRRPLLFYAVLEMGVALFAALTPALLSFVREVYVELGGSVAMGTVNASLVRLAGAVVVLSVPTFLMGGSLPAAARAAQMETDAGRRAVSLLYGVNTMGAVTGCLTANFVFLEVMGALRTLGVACLLNLLVAVLARALGSRMEDPVGGDKTRPLTGMGELQAWATAGRGAPAWFVLTAACVVGFAFFLMELVWYRMLGPILGGTIFTFGLILATALLGIGLGGMAYAVGRGEKPATLSSFAFTCLLEALCVALPLALGDRLAVWAIVLRPLGALGFGGYVFGWALIAGVTVLPAAFVAGVQFPMLIGLLGQGRHAVGYQIGLAYAWNTVGAIAGALAGGFGLMPLLTAPGCWRVVGWLLLALGTLSVLLAASRGTSAGRLLWPVVLSLVVVGLLLAPGPTAAWRHSPIGVGRVPVASVEGANRLRNWLNGARRIVLKEVEGVESSVALQGEAGLAFVLNGKVDGNARGDAGTQVMGGILPAVLHGQVRKAMVIGLGTGSTAGWLGAVPGIERVDVVELEPTIVDVARQCAAVNKNALENPRVHIIIGDAREVLQAIRERYDVIFSEPSNPYRAGVASLYAQEFYRSVSQRLAEGGIFVQWVQAYEVDAQTVRTVMATLRSVFPHVEIWMGEVADLLLLASRDPLPHDVRRVRERLRQEPYAEAVGKVWRVVGMEGFFARFIGGSGLVDAVARVEGRWVNTDDRNLVEFGFSRSLGRPHVFNVSAVLETARVRGEHRVPTREDGPDWHRVEELRLGSGLFRRNSQSLDLGPKGEEAEHRLKARQAYWEGDLEQALAEWRLQPAEPVTLEELSLVAESLAVSGEEEALVYADQLARTLPTEAELIRAELHAARGDMGGAVDTLERGFRMLRQDPWPAVPVVGRALSLALRLSVDDASAGRRLIEAMGQPFSVYVAEGRRQATRWQIAARAKLDDICVQVIEELEPHIPWELEFLRFRQSCYETHDHPLTERARADLKEYVVNAPLAFSDGLLPRAAR